MSQSPWDTYWQSHHTANSFGCDYTENEGPYGIVNRHWLDVFQSMDATGKVVDLGAGNGALAKLALDALGKTPCASWVSSDLVKVYPSVKHEDVTFLQVNAESMPFANQSVDHFVSMFGIEYGDLQKVFDEVARCLSPRGKFDFILHHADSIISQQSKVTLAVSQRCLSSHVWDALSSYSTMPIDQVKQTLLQMLNQQMQLASNDQEREEVQLIGHSIFTLCQSMPTSAAIVKGLASIQTQLASQAVRLSQQLAASLQAKNLSHLLEDSQLSCYKISTLNSDNMLIGWQVSGHAVSTNK